MKFKSAITALITPLALAGCAGATIGLRSTNSPSLAASAPPPGTSYSSGSVTIQADVTPGAFFGLFFLGYIVSGMQDTYRHWSNGSPSHKPPELDAERTVAVRDCREPLGPLYANLRCN
jgi:hypothetical protein